MTCPDCEHVQSSLERNSEYNMGYWRRSARLQSTRSGGVSLVHQPIYLSPTSHSCRGNWRSNLYAVPLSLDSLRLYTREFIKQKPVGLTLVAMVVGRSYSSSITLELRSSLLLAGLRAEVANHKVTLLSDFVFSEISVSLRVQVV